MDADSVNFINSEHVHNFNTRTVALPRPNIPAVSRQDQGQFYPVVLIEIKNDHRGIDDSGISIALRQNHVGTVSTHFLKYKCQPW
jgi:hypothetical protein